MKPYLQIVQLDSAFVSAFPNLPTLLEYLHLTFVPNGCKIPRMGYQTTEALVLRKLRPWLRRGVITRVQYNALVAYCVEHGFWKALGRATKTKYGNLRQGIVSPSKEVLSKLEEDPSEPKAFRLQRGKRFVYKTVFIPKRELLHMDYVTNGSWSKRRQKRHRTWVNGYFLEDGTEIQDYLKEKYPGWVLINIARKQGVYVLRKELEQ